MALTLQTNTPSLTTITLPGVGSGEKTRVHQRVNVLYAKDNTIVSSPLFFWGVVVCGWVVAMIMWIMTETTWPPNILRVKQGCQGFFRGRGGDELPSHRRHTFFYKLQESLRLQEKQHYVILSCIPSKREAPCLGLAVCCARTRCAERS